MKGFPKPGSFFSSQNDPTTLKTAEIDEERIKMIAKDWNKFYKRVCLILMKQITLVPKNIDPDIDLDHEEFDQKLSQTDQILESNIQKKENML